MDLVRNSLEFMYKKIPKITISLREKWEEGIRKGKGQYCIQKFNL